MEAVFGKDPRWRIDIWRYKYSIVWFYLCCDQIIKLTVHIRQHDLVGIGSYEVGDGQVKRGARNIDCFYF